VVELLLQLALDTGLADDGETGAHTEEREHQPVHDKDDEGGHEGSVGAVVLIPNVLCSVSPDSISTEHNHGTPEENHKVGDDEAAGYNVDEQEPHGLHAGNLPILLCKDLSTNCKECHKISD